MLPCYLTSSDQKAIPVRPLTAAELEGFCQSAGAGVADWVSSTNFTAKPGKLCLIPGSNGRLEQVLFGVDDHDDFWALGALPNVLPKGVYSLTLESAQDAFRSHLAWGLGAYRFSAYRKQIRILIRP